MNLVVASGFRAQVQAALALGFKSESDHIRFRMATAKFLSYWDRSSSTSTPEPISIGNELIVGALADLATNIKNESSLYLVGMDTFALILASLPDEVIRSEGTEVNPRTILNELFWQPYLSPPHVGFVNARRARLLTRIEANLQGNPRFRSQLIPFIQDLTKMKTSLSQGTQEALDLILNRYYQELR